MNVQRTNGRSVTVGLPERRYRLIDKDGMAYSPFRLKPGVEISDITDHAFPGQDQDPDEGWDLEILNPAGVQVVGADR